MKIFLKLVYYYKQNPYLQQFGVLKILNIFNFDFKTRYIYFGLDGGMFLKKSTIYKPIRTLIKDIGVTI